jgi:hypothetical protein
MKVALLLSGQLRKFPEAFATWKDWLLPQVTDTYYFCSMPAATQPQVRDLIPDAMGGYCHDFQIPKRDVIPLQDLEHAQAMESQWWKVQQCSYLLTDHYDLVVRMRPDLIFAPGTRLDLASFNPHFIHVPKLFSWGGYCDELAIGGQDIMDTYCDFYNHLNCWVGGPDFNRAFPWSGNSESRLYAYLNGRVPVQRFDVGFCHVKADGRIDGTIPSEQGLMGFDGRPL